MCKKNLFFGILLLSCQLIAQNLEWAIEQTDVYSTSHTCSDVDTEGNFVDANNFSGTIDMDPSSTEVNFTSSFGVDMYFRKLNLNGDLVWSKHISGSGHGFVENIKTDQDINIYLSGSFTGTFDFDPSSANYDVTCNDLNGDAFLVKYNDLGEFEWVRTLAGNQLDKSLKISIDHFDNIFTFSKVSGNIDFNPDPILIDTLGINGSYHVIQKFSSDGIFQWVTETPEILNFSLNSEGELFAVGEFNNTIQFGALSLTSSGKADGFLAGMSNGGVWNQAIQLGGLQDDVVKDITIDETNHIYITGEFENSLIWNDNTITSVGSETNNFYFSKLSNNLTGIWFNNYPKNNKTQIDNIVLDEYSNLLFSGRYQGGFDLGGYSNVLTNSSASSNSIFGKMNSNGIAYWLNDFVSSGFNIALDFNIYPNNYIYLSGKFTNETNFGLNGSSTLLSPSNGWTGGLYHSLIKICDPIIEGDIKDYFCTSFVAPSGKEITTVGMHNDTIASSMGCDSIIAIELNDFVATVENVNDTLFANIKGASYQWINCAGNTDIESAVNSWFVPTQPGDYSVRIKRNECLSTSNCLSVFPIGIDEEKELSVLEISPNPSTGIINIDFSDLNENVELKLMNTIGKVVKRETRQVNGLEELNFDQQEAGVYILEIKKVKSKTSKQFKLILK